MSQAEPGFGIRSTQAGISHSLHTARLLPDGARTLDTETGIMIYHTLSFLSLSLTSWNTLLVSCKYTPWTVTHRVSVVDSPGC